MGVVSVLEHHAALQSSPQSWWRRLHPRASGPASVEVEYRLYSWGEIFAHFLGDREHSVAARFILRDFPFKLFSTSAPYDDPLPQKLTLTFRAPYEERGGSGRFKQIGVFPHEVAEEFAAFLSVVTRRRVFLARQTRQDGLPIEEQAGIYQRGYSQERQQMKEIDPAEVHRLLDNLLNLERRIANSFILALRLYHAAVQMLYTEPEFSYLFLVTSLEAISSAVFSDYEPEDRNEFLDSRFPRWREIAGALEQEDRESFADLLVRNERYTFRKLFKFVHEYLPDKFWSETTDDAKPDHFVGIISPGPEGRGEERISRSEKKLESWETIEKTQLERTLRNIYDARSALIHRGVPFDPSIVVGHFWRFPPEAFRKIIENSLAAGGGGALNVPPLLTFERLVSYSLVNYLGESA